MTQLSKEQQEAIDNYGGQIKTLKDFVTAVRKRPGMYLGPLSNRGLLNMMREIFQNSIDQITDPTSPANWFSFFYDERTLEVIVEDNGKGFPFDDIIRILTAQHTSKNFEKKLYEYSSGLNGVGSKIVNALSERFTAESFRYDGTAVKVDFVKGYPTTKNPVKIPNKEKKQGSRITFIPDTEILGEMNLEWKSVYRLIKNILSMTPIGSRCDFEAIDIHGKKYSETIINKDGIITNLIMTVKNPINKPIIIGADDGMHKLECAICFDAGEADGPSDDMNITSFSNFCPTLSGTHVDGTIEGLARWFSQYMNNIYLANQKSKDKLKVMPIDIKTGLNVFITAAHIEPNFTGQAKEILSNEDMVGFCKETVLRGLDEWSKANPQDLQKLCKFFKDIAELRMKQEGAKQKIVTKYAKNPITNLPRKYKKPINKTGIELIIVEGDSALGKAETNRDQYTQGLFPIRGKIINAFKATKQAFFSNEEVQGITQIIFGQEYKKGLTVEDAKVEKIIIMADGDIDGNHISALLLRMFVMYFPFLIEAGMVYKAVAPLYSIKEGKKRRYFTENIDFIKYLQKTFIAQNDFRDTKKNPLQPKDLTKFFLNNTDYIYYLEKIANTYAVDPYLLEIVLDHYIINGKTIKFDKLKKEIKSAYRFMDVEMNGNIVVVKGTIDKSNLIIISDKFLSDCTSILNIIESNNSIYYLLNGKKSSLYTIMKAYEAVTPPNRQRYKGLGEMNGNELGESTLRPDGDRTLIRYTMDSAKEAIDFIREYESNSKKILSEIGSVTREDLLD